MMQPADHTTVTIPTYLHDGLRLRAPRWDDFEIYAAFRASDRAVGVGGPYNRAQSFSDFAGMVGHWHLRGYGRWIVADAENDTPLGAVGLMFPEDWPEPEIAWSVFDGVEGKSIARRAAEFARSYAYTVLGWTRVISCTLPGNTRSEALAQRLGAVREGTHAHPDLGPLTVWRHLSPAELA